MIQYRRNLGRWWQCSMRFHQHNPLLPAVYGTFSPAGGNWCLLPVIRQLVTHVVSVTSGPIDTSPPPDPVTGAAAHRHRYDAGTRIMGDRVTGEAWRNGGITPQNNPRAPPVKSDRLRAAEETRARTMAGQGQSRAMRVTKGQTNRGHRGSQFRSSLPSWMSLLLDSVTFTREKTNGSHPAASILDHHGASAPETSTSGVFRVTRPSGYAALGRFGSAASGATEVASRVGRPRLA